MDMIVRRFSPRSFASEPRRSAKHFPCAIWLWSIGYWLCIANMVCGQAPPPTESALVATEPLSVQIDRLLTSDVPHLTAGRAPDGQLLRRLSLDLRGVVPTGEELTAFTADSAPDKWAAWTKRFLTDPLHQERMVDWYDKSLMQRRPFGQVERAAWLAWLRQIVAERVGLHTLVQRMLSAPWWDNSQRPALRFFLDRTGDPHLITRDLGRILLGRDMQCAQCHDHPVVDEYKQFDYHGLLAFVSSSSLVEASAKDDKGAEKKWQMYVERPGADAPFESVFDKGVNLRSGPRLPVSTEILEAYLEPDARLQAEQQVGALTGVPKSPVTSRRQELSNALLADQPRLLARNFANRLWAVAFGRGLVHPLDMHHADNPPSHPELLDLLTTALIDLQFDPDRFLEQLVLTDAYCRASELPWQPWPISSAPVDAFAMELAEIEQTSQAIKPRLASELSSAVQADQQADAAVALAKTAWLTAQAARHATRTELDKAEAAFGELSKRSDQANAARDVATKKHQDTLSRSQLLEEANTKIQQALTLLAAEDAELKQALATSKARSESARAELPALEKAAADAQAAAVTALAALDAARIDLKAKATALTVQHESLAKVDAAYASARLLWAEKHSRVLTLEAAIARHDRCQLMVQAMAAARAAASERTAAESLVATHRAQVVALDAQRRSAAEALAVGEKDRSAAATTATAARDAMTVHALQIEQLRETVRQLEKASAVVLAPEALKAAVQSIQETLSARESASAQLAAELTKSEQALVATQEKMAQLKKAAEAIDQTGQALQATIAAAQTSFEDRSKKLDAAIAHARECWEAMLTDRRGSFAVIDMRPQSPEQLGRSILRVTGIFDNYVNAELAELQKSQPLPPDAPEADHAQRQLIAVRQATDKLQGNIDVFANLFASGVGQTADEFFASPDQALYMSNAGAVFTWAAASGQNVTQRVVAQTEPGLAAADLYRTLLAREPSATEAAFVAEQLTAAGDGRAAVAQDLVWGILTGVEFRFYR